MNLFGFEIKRASERMKAAGTAFEERTMLNAVRAANPRLPVRAPSTTEIMPPFGTNPPARPIVQYDSPLDERAVTSDPRDLWYLALPAKLTPNQVTQILRSAQGGDLWQQFQLGQLMLDTWPMLRKCDHEIREAASSVRYVARPYCEEGADPTPSAKAKADLVNRCFRSMKPNQFSDERGFKGMIYHMAGGFLMGLMLEELLWEKQKSYPGFGYEQRLRAAAFVHPRHFTFTDQGTLAVFDNSYNRLYFNMAKVGQAPDPRKFICGQFYSASGSTLGAGFLRPLAWYWTSVVFNREWMARMAQNYGAPFLDVTYKPGMEQHELLKLDENIKQGLANRFIRHPEGTLLETTPAQSLGSENPQRYLAEQADKQCQLLLLGQTLTTDVSDSGSRALGDVHMSVRSDRVEGVAKWLAGEPLTQLARSILLVNYGEDSECPSVEADFNKPMEPMEQAQFLQTISNCSLPLPAEETYAKIGVTMPEEGDKVLIRGQIGVLGATDQPMDPSPEQTAQDYEMSLGEVQAKLARLGPRELADVEQLILAAERAPHHNGEWKAVQAKLQLNERNRI